MYYTKYRPKDFTQIAQPNSVSDALIKQLLDNKIDHAYLFVGPRGTGKTTMARLLAKALNAEKVTKKGELIGDEAIFDSIQKGSFTDLIEIDAASNRGIDDIRELKAKIKLAPSVGKYKVYIVDEVHMLTPEAFNALLKTLEEPPSHIVFVLCTTEIHKVPDTIKSRCQVFTFKRATQEQLVTRLSQIAEQEGAKDITKADLSKIAKAAHGGYRDAETMLQQVIEGGLDIDEFISISSNDQYQSFLTNLLNKDQVELIKYINKLIDDGIDFDVWLSGLLNYSREILLLKNNVPLNDFDFTTEQTAQVKEYLSSVSNKDLTNIIEELLKVQEKMISSSIQQLPLELFIIEHCSETQLDTQSTKNSPAPQGNAQKTSNQIGDNKNSTSNETEKNKNLSQEEIDFGLIDIPSELSSVLDVKLIPETELKSEKILNNVKQLAKIIESWPSIITKTVEFNNSIHALLKSSEPTLLQGDILILDVMYAFHKERLEANKNRKIVEDVIHQETGIFVTLKCIINPKRRPVKKQESTSSGGELTDLNVVAPSDLNKFFDGGLPL